MAINHEMNYYNYGKTLSADGIIMPLSPKGKKESHDYVDLGLSVKWATCNIGASAPEETGLYFAWGETQGYTSGQVGTNKYFAWEGEHADYEFGEWVDQEPDYGMTKYNSDGITTLETTDDAAYVNWGSDWRMPTKDEFDELLENTTSSWTEVNGVSGMLLTSTVEGHEEETLFFPAVGYAYGGQVYSIGEDGSYWSASLGSKSVNYAYRLGFGSGYCGVDSDSRCCGYAVRSVFSQNL